MQPTVIAVLVARNGARYLPRTLSALAAQTVQPASVVTVDLDSSDGSAASLTSVGPGEVLAMPGRASFGAAVAAAVRSAPSASGPDEWLWLLRQDNAPEPDALAALLGAVEIAPSVAVAGPKLMDWTDDRLIAGFGETVTGFGRSIPVVSDEIDQAQHDVQSDFLAVAEGGMLVRRTAWSALGGFDPGLPSADAALDFCIRARLAGHRVIGVPGARISSAGPVELFGRRSISAAARNRIRRRAQLHRRLVYAPPVAVPLHWLSLLPLAILRCIWQLGAKRPTFVGGELAAAVKAAFDGRVLSARGTLRRSRVVGWEAISRLRMPWAAVRDRRITEREATLDRARGADRLGFFLGGGAWTVLIAAVIGIVAFGRLLEAPALVGGGLLPLSATSARLWAHVGYSWHEAGAGFLGASDPFASVLATLGTLAFWAPSSAIVGLYLVAMPLAASTAWWCAARITSRPWAAATGAILWAVAPPFLASLTTGHLGAVLAHILLPTLVLSMLGAARSWSSAALAALTFAVVAASSPVLIPAMLIGLIAWAASHPRGIGRLIGIPIPAAALFLPLIVEQVRRGNLLALLVDPGVPQATSSPTGWQLAVGATGEGAFGWDALLIRWGATSPTGPALVALLLLPIAALVVAGLFVRGSRRAIPALAIALLGYLTAVASGQLRLAGTASETAAIWAGSGLSLYWLGLVGAVVIALAAIRRVAIVSALAASLCAVALAVPVLVESSAGTIPVRAGSGRLLPAFASAEAATDPTLGTLELSPIDSGAIGSGAVDSGAITVGVQRGLGTTLDEVSTLASTDRTIHAADDRLATLAGNISSTSGYDIRAELDALRIGFVLVAPSATTGQDAIRQRVVEALDGNRILTPVGTSAAGTLWAYSDGSLAAAPSGPGPAGTTIGAGILLGQGVIFASTLLLAIPTTRRRRISAPKVIAAPAGTTDSEVRP